MRLLIKKVLISTFFCVCLSLSSTGFIWANTATSCPDSHAASEFTVHHITDGDTLVLNNGERVRILGINTPEVNFKKPERSDPMAIEARQRLQQLLPDGTRVRLVFDERKKDRYKRLLAFVRYGNDLDVGEQLLEEGLAWQYLILPNQLCWQRYRKAEDKAFNNGLGVWNTDNYRIRNASDAEVSGKKRQYARLRGEITGTEHSSKNYWFIIDDRVWIGISRKDASQHFGGMEQYQIGQSILVSGWMYKSYDKIRIKPRHPQAIRILKRE